MIFLHCRAASFIANMVILKSVNLTNATVLGDTIESFGTLDGRVYYSSTIDEKYNYYYDANIFLKK